VGLRKLTSKLQLSMQSFWKENPMVPTWTNFIIAWWNTHPPKLLSNRIDKPIYNVAECTIRKASIDDIHMLPEFWNNFYSQSQKTKCCIPLDAIQNTWDIWVMIHPTTGIIGSVVRRWIYNVHIREAFFPKIGAIEYFCVHPAWRKKGIGRRLLWKAQESTQGIIPHLILWETFQIQIPPISAGMYWIKQCQAGQGIIADEKEASIAWYMCRKNTDIYSEYTYSKGKETVVWKTESGYIVVWNTYHRTIPEGQWIGIVLGQSSERALDEFTQSCPFGILISDTQRDEWSSSTSFQWISYMLSTGFISTSIPYLSWV
jgi:GNAT superfamily N-acetyltransferase